MIKEHFDFLKKVLVTVDICIVIISFVIAYYVRNLFEDLFPFKAYLSIIPILSITWFLGLYLTGTYTSWRLKDRSEVIIKLLKAVFFSFVIFSSTSYFLHLTYLSRSFIVIHFIVATVLLGIEKIFIIEVLKYLRRRGYNFRNILLVGTGRRAQNFIDMVHNHKEWGLNIIGLIDEDVDKIGQTVKNYKIIGSFLDVPKILHDYIVDEVVFVVPRSWFGKIEEIIRFIQLEGIRVRVAVDLFDIKQAKVIQTDISGYPMLTFEMTPTKIGQLFIKRVIDFVVSAVLLIVLLPVFLFIALIIKMTSEGPVFFVQERVGLNGRKFKLYKFRTMVRDAEEKLKDIMHENEMQGPVFKSEKDPRITKVGKFLRKFSLDELPQLWNVFKGEMSLVGPRPPLPSEVNKYDNWQRRRLSMKPGITCLWQVQGRNNIRDFNTWAKLDLLYIDTWSLALDFKILLKTIPAVFLGIGAK